MKVLFAVSNENISESIMNKYKSMYKEIISGKNVYYFNAILKELQKDKSYDRIVISEDLEPFANKNYDTIDNFIFEKLDKISDEATTNSGEDIPIIIISTDRRTRGEAILSKIFGIGIYSALLGQDRSIENVCELINKPRTKKEAKIYYKIDSSDVDYKAETEEDVSELEIQNILTHYKRLGKNEEKYVESFNSIANQYTDEQLKIIIKFLPLGVKAVLEASCPKYQQMAAFSGESKQLKKQQPYSSSQINPKTKKERSTKQAIIDNGIKIESINSDETIRPTKPVVIPGTVSTKNVKKVQIAKKEQTQTKINNEPINKEKVASSIENVEQPKKGRGRPKKVSVQEENKVEEPKKRRGRPKKVQTEEADEKETTKTKNNDILSFEIEEENVSNVRNTTKAKNNKHNDILLGFEELEDDEDDTLPGFEELEDDEDDTIPGFEELEGDEDDTLPGFEELEDEEDDTLPGFEELEDDEDDTLPGFEELEDDEDDTLPGFEEKENIKSNSENNETVILSGSNNIKTTLKQMKNTIQENENIEEKQIVNYNNTPNSNIQNLLTSDKKIVAFVGTTKNGTSFLVNNIADIISNQGIKTAILDLTQNRNSYYIYTKNEDNLRNTAMECTEKLVNGVAQGITVNKNLDVYTSLPSQNNETQNYEAILSTLLENYSLILLDCDFKTEYDYLKESQEIYLVQSMDVLTIQPLTAYLRDLKAKNILDENKLRIVINKYTKVRSVTERTIIGGMSFYNDPSMSFMTELFNRENIRYAVIPFEMQTYTKYLEGLINCNITTSGYSKEFTNALRKLENMVYPLLTNEKRKYNNPKYNKYAKK